MAVGSTAQSVMPHVAPSTTKQRQTRKTKHGRYPTIFFKTGLRSGVGGARQTEAASGHWPFDFGRPIGVDSSLHGVEVSDGVSASLSLGRSTCISRNAGWVVAFADGTQTANGGRCHPITVSDRGWTGRFV